MYICGGFDKEGYLHSTPITLSPGFDARCRGVLIALPVFGVCFVAHLAHADCEWPVVAACAHERAYSLLRGPNSF